MRLRRPDRIKARTALERFLFDPADPLSAGIFRIGLAGMVLLVFRPGGTVLDRAIRDAPWAAELFTGLFLTPPYTALIVLLSALFGVGIRPRPVGFALAAALTPLVLREGREHGRFLLVFALLAFSFLRSDARLTPRALSAGRPPSQAGPLWPVRLIQVELSLLYGVNALAKATPAFLRGDVLVAQSRMLPNFLEDLSGGSISLGPVALPIWMGAVAAPLIEAFLALAFWVPGLRVPTAVLGLVFHALLSRVIRIGYLDLVTVFLYCAFLLPFARRRARELPPQLEPSSGARP